MYAELGDTASAVTLDSLSSITVDHSLVQGGYPGEENMDVLPDFESVVLRDYRLRADSPLREQGRNGEILGARFPVGSSLVDTDEDGLPDIGTEPRDNPGDQNMHLLKNLGGVANFVDVTLDPAIVDVVPWGNSETLCWADVDHDGHLDAFLPVYPFWTARTGPGNFFLHSLGPTGPGGLHSE